jgi:hypothetical protein
MAHYLVIAFLWMIGSKEECSCDYKFFRVIKKIGVKKSIGGKILLKKEGPGNDK